MDFRPGVGGHVTPFFPAIVASRDWSSFTEHGKPNVLRQCEVTGHFAHWKVVVLSQALQYQTRAHELISCGYCDPWFSNVQY